MSDHVGRITFGPSGPPAAGTIGKPLVFDESRLVSDADAEKISREIETGTRGPVLLKWIGLLLEDRKERVRALRAAGVNLAEGGGK
jgi:hypothetical protein